MATAEVALITRRRRFTLDQKRQLLAEAECTSMTEVARRHGIARTLLQKWKLTLGEPLALPDVSGFARLVPAAPVGDEPSEPRIFVHVDSVVVELPATSAPEQVAALVFALKR